MLVMALIFCGSGFRPCGVRMCPTNGTSLMHSFTFFGLKIRFSCLALSRSSAKFLSCSSVLLPETHRSSCRYNFHWYTFKYVMHSFLKYLRSWRCAERHSEKTVSAPGCIEGGQLRAMFIKLYLTKATPCI